MKPLDDTRNDTGRKLKNDAQAIEARVGPDLRKRIDAAIAAAGPGRAKARRAHAPRPMTWAAVATGLGAVALIVLLAGREPPPAPTPTAVADVPLVLPEPLALRTVEFTGPLTQELDHLRADLEKAAKSIERDLRDSL